MHPDRPHEQSCTSCGVEPHPPKTMPDPATDPVCGMKVDRAAARGGSFDHSGETFFFCSPSCKQKFAAEPDRYLQRAAPEPTHVHHPASTQKRIYTCPMHPEIVRDRSRAPARSAAWRSSRGRSTADDEANPELADMQRRFWVSLALTRAGRRCSRCPITSRVSRSSELLSAAAARLAPARAGDAGRALGRLAVLRARLGVDRQPAPEHVHADRARDAAALRVQRVRDALARRCLPHSASHGGGSRRSTSRPPR